MVTTSTSPSPAAKPAPKLTPGAGVVRVLKPGKRLRNWHRATNSLSDLHKMPLRAFARMLSRIADTAADRERQKVARSWLTLKGVRP